VNVQRQTNGFAFLTGLSPTEKNLLKKCLGNADFDTTNNVQLYNWDYGNMYYPHIIKLVRTVTVYTDGGYYVALWWDSTASAGLDNSGVSGAFKLLNPFTTPDGYETDTYEVYTTKGTLALTSNASQAVFSFASNSVYLTNSTYDLATSLKFDGDISCEVGNNNAAKMPFLLHCLNKTDIFTLLSWNNPTLNPPHINLYTATRLFTKPYDHLVWERNLKANKPTNELHFLTHVINTDLATNWGAYSGYSGDGVQPKPRTQFRVYKFFPATSSTYNYVAQCSNRGICQTDTGLCSCFPGYTHDDCSVQNSIAL